MVGCEIDPGAIDFAQDRITAAGISNTDLSSVDASRPFPATLRDKPFDAIVGRAVLLYLPDRRDTRRRRKITNARRSGLSRFSSRGSRYRRVRRAPVRKVIFCIFESMRRCGAQPDMGPRLQKVFAAAGLPQPNMRYER